MTNPADLLIDQETGELDWTWIKRLAVIRAERDFGAANPPLRYVRQQITWAKDRACSMRAAWRRDHGLQQAQPALNAYANGSSQKLIAGVQAAKSAKAATDHDSAVEFLTSRKFSLTRSKAILEQGEKEEGRPPRSIWDMAQAITANARSQLNTDDRLQQELVAQAILNKVA